MNKEEIALRKLALVMEAKKELEQYEEVLDELRTAAFEILLLHPGCTFDLWKQILLEQYSVELKDAYCWRDGKIEELWEFHYKDFASGLCYSYHDWSKAFATTEAVQMYYDMIEKLKIVSAK